MFSIKFKKSITVSIDKQIEIISKFCDLIGVTKQNYFYSDFTFEKVEESKYLKIIDNGIVNKEIDTKTLRDKYISLEGNFKDKKFKVEINPTKSRKNVENCSNIDFNIIDEPSLYEFIKDKITDIEKLLNSYYFISEFYFINLNSTPNTYNDEEFRIYQKQNSEIEFTDLLLEEEYKKFENPLERETFKNNSHNVMHKVFEDVSSDNSIITDLIEEHNLNVSVGSGSLIIQGEDTEKFIKLLREKIITTTNQIQEKDIYSQYFKKNFGRK
ncbi:MAG: hypothetical protein LAT82_03910 [Nanoarchaeota archaeon]|nr:hypothetical protein [Nanoarchaeota archaeon]